MESDLFAYNWKVYEGSTAFFWFEEENGVFGYRMSHNPDELNLWDKESALGAMHEWTKLNSRVETLGPYLSEVPPLIMKIRTMEQRHKRYLERKNCDQFCAI